MAKKPKALDIAGWRRTQTEPDPRGGTKQLTQKTLAVLIDVAPGHLCRVERGERWSRLVLDSVFDLLPLRITYANFESAQLATWRAYSPDRKGMTP